MIELSNYLVELNNLKDPILIKVVPLSSRDIKKYLSQAAKQAKIRITIRTITGGESDDNGTYVYIQKQDAPKKYTFLQAYDKLKK